MEHAPEPVRPAAPTALRRQIENPTTPAPFRAPTPAVRLLALQRLAGNSAVCTSLASTAVVQRGILDDAWNAATAAGKATMLAAEITGLLMTDPNRAFGLLAQLAWDEVPEAVKGQLIDALLQAAEAAARHSPSPMPGFDVGWAAISRGVAGFLARIRTGYSTEQKVAVANRIIGLWANPTGNFSMGFLAGLAEGLWDGISGPFVLVWDVVKLEAQILELQGRMLAALARSDSRHQIFAAMDALYQRVSAAVAAGWAQLMAGKVDPAALLAAMNSLQEMVDKAVEGAGGTVADALMQFLMSAPDKDLGHALGRVEGNLIFEAALIALTDGGYEALKTALSGVRWITEALESLSALRASVRASEAAEMFGTALNQFLTFIRSNRVLSPVADAVGEIWTLFVKFVKLSYGLEGGAERAAKRVAPGAETLEEGVRIMRELPGGGRIKLLENGRIAICHSPCMYIEQRFARELDGAGAQFRTQLEDIARRERAAMEAGDRAAEEALFTEADAINTQLENMRLGTLRATSGLDEATLRELLLEANDNTQRVEALLHLAGNDPAKIRPVLAYCGRDEATLERMTEALGLFEAPRLQPGGVLVDPALHPFHPTDTANMPHFLDEHTLEYFDVNQLGNSVNKTFWPPGTGPAELQGHLLEALQKVSREGRWERGSWVQRVVQLDNGVLVQVGATPGRIGQFFPLGGPGIRVFSNEELRAIARFFGR